MTRTPAPPSLGRRRVLAITAAAAGLALPLGRPLKAWATQTQVQSYRWTGRALGGEAEIILYHGDRQTARRLVEASVDEIERLENEFSLYRADSALSRLNRDGSLALPSHDMLRLLSASRRFGQLTGGAFDISAGILWKLYTRHFAKPGSDPRGPDPETVKAVLARVDYRSIGITGTAVNLLRDGMQLSLNGIAQGYITDRVADLLRSNGMNNVLINLGEIRGLGGRDTSDRPWRVGIRRPGSAAPVETIPLLNEAVATSAESGFRFGGNGHHHLFDPRTGLSSNLYDSVSVIAPTAIEADALSTAFASLAPHEVKAVIAKRRRTRALLFTQNGDRVAVGA